MGKLNKIERISVYVFAVSIFFMIFLTNIFSVAYSREYYSEKMTELHVENNFPFKVDVKQKAYELVDFLEHGGELNETFYNFKERTHLHEVRDLFSFFRGVVYFFVVLSVVAFGGIIYCLHKRYIALSSKGVARYVKKLMAYLLTRMGFVIFVFVLVFSLMSVTFSHAFFYLHKILFRSTTWMLDPAVDNLIRLMPEQFFFDAFLRILLMTAVFGVVFLVAGVLVERYPAKTL